MLYVKLNYSIDLKVMQQGLFYKDKALIYYLERFQSSSSTSPGSVNDSFQVSEGKRENRNIGESTVQKHTWMPGIILDD